MYKNLGDAELITSSLNKIIPVYFWNKNFDGKKNFGDMVSKDIVEYISGAKVVHVGADVPNKLLATGSILTTSTYRSKCVVWGSGTLNPKTVAYNPHIRFCAVRGPLTRNVLMKAGYKLPPIYGDPALLLPRIYNPKIQKTHKLGIILHWRHREQIKIHPSVKYIEILRTPDEKFKFIDDILSCEYILSTSLHGLIVSDAYGVPNKYCTVANKKLEGEEHFKFNDYFESVGRNDVDPLLLNSSETITDGFVPKVLEHPDVNLDLDLLTDVFPYDFYYDVQG